MKTKHLIALLLLTCSLLGISACTDDLEEITPDTTLEPVGVEGQEAPPERD